MFESNFITPFEPREVKEFVYCLKHKNEPTCYNLARQTCTKQSKDKLVEDFDSEKCMIDKLYGFRMNETANSYCKVTYNNKMLSEKFAYITNGDVVSYFKNKVVKHNSLQSTGEKVCGDTGSHKKTKPVELMYEDEMKLVTSRFNCFKKSVSASESEKRSFV